MTTYNRIVTDIVFSGIARISKDPQMRYTPAGIAVLDVQLVSDKYLPKSKQQSCPDGWKESSNKAGWVKTTWLKITVWRERAEALANILKQGCVVKFEAELGGMVANGSVQPRIWAGNDGEKRASFEGTMTRLDIIAWPVENGEAAEDGKGHDTSTTQREYDGGRDDGFGSDDIPW